LGQFLMKRWPVHLIAFKTNKFLEILPSYIYLVLFSSQWSHPRERNCAYIYYLLSLDEP
jgi:hypothetical protein